MSSPEFVTQMLRHWKLAAPNLVLEMTACTTNPRSHIQPRDFANSPDFEACSTRGKLENDAEQWERLEGG